MGEVLQQRGGAVARSRARRDSRRSPVLGAVRWFFRAPEVSRERALGWTERITALTALTASVEYARGGSQVAPGQLNSLAVFGLPERGLLRPVARILSSPAAPKVANGLRIAAGAALILPTGRRVRAAANATLGATTWFLFLAERYGTDGSDEVVLIASATSAVGRATSNPVVADAALWYLTLQSALSYLSSGAAKLLGPTWMSGRALDVIFRTRSYGHEGLSRWLRARPALSRALTRGVVAAELVAPLLLLARGRLTKLYVVATGGFHLGTGLVMGLGRFFTAFSALYPAVLYVGVPNRGDRDDRMPVWSGAILGGALAAGLVDVELGRRALARDAATLRSFTTSDGTRLGYRVDGPEDGELVVLLEAGAGESLTYGDELAPRLAAEHTVVRYSRAGYHGSAAADSSDEPGLSRHAEHARELLAHVARGRGVVLAGHSLGSLIVRRLAAAPDLDVRAVVLLDGTHPSIMERISLTHARTRPAITAAVWSLRAGLGWLIGPRSEYRSARPELRKKLEREQRAWRTWLTVRDELDRVAAEAAISPDFAPGIPVLVLTAEGTARTDPEQVSADEALAAASEHGAHRVIERSAHLTMLLAPAAAERAAVAIREWLAEVHR